MMTPEAVIDYVVIHEVAHLREMNHTERFWKLVADECPRWREHRRWLDEHGAWLTAGPVRAG
jgi:predicted metal-dependent hydrolase